ncbi:MAG: hypothetical protein KF751_09240 [Nitrospira sp.]|nr:hypothetical protein [Nitrospira sp.]
MASTRRTTSLLISMPTAWEIYCAIRTLEAGIAALHFDDGCDEFRSGTLGAGFAPRG